VVARNLIASSHNDSDQSAQVCAPRSADPDQCWRR